MSDGERNGDTAKFVLIAVKHEAAYWTPQTIAQEICLNGLFDSEAEISLTDFRDGILKRLVGRSGEKFWSNDAITPARAAAIRSACQALHELTVERFSEITAEMASKSPSNPSPDRTR
jgi:hypothetical protein